MRRNAQPQHRNSGDRQRNKRRKHSVIAERRPLSPAEITYFLALENLCRAGVRARYARQPELAPLAERLTVQQAAAACQGVTVAAQRYPGALRQAVADLRETLAALELGASHR